MKALLLKDVNKLVYSDVPDPQILPNEVMIEIKACGICGSDIHGMDGSSGRRIPPVIMGHEASGIISKTGQAVEKWQIGDRVTFDSTIYPLDDWYTKKGMYNLSDKRMVMGVSCTDYTRNGAFAQYLNVPQHILHKIPQDVSYNFAAMTEPLAVAIHAVNLSSVSENDSVVVIGTGIIGLLVIQVLNSRNVKQIIAIDRQQERLDLAKKLGASVTLNAGQSNITDQIKKISDGRGVDMAFEAVGLGDTVNLAIDTLRKGGSAVLLGNITAEINFPLQKIVTQQINVQGSCAINGEYPEALNMIKNKQVNLELMISAVAHLSEGAEWFKRLYNKEKGLLKVILNP